MRLINVSLTLAIAFAIVLGTERVHGLAGTLDHPSISFLQDEKELQRDEVMKALNMEGARFLGGQFVNAFTTLRYGGDTAALNRFIEKLADCRGAKVVIAYHGKLINETATWLVQHMAWGNPRQFVISIYKESPRFDASLLKLPAKVSIEGKLEQVVGGSAGIDGQRVQ